MEKNNLSVGLSDYKGTNIEKSFIGNDLEKAVYKDNEENRKLGRVGKEYGGKGSGKQEEPTKKKGTAGDIRASLTEKVKKMSDSELVDRAKKHSDADPIDHERWMIANDVFDAEIKGRGISSGEKKQDKKEEFKEKKVEENITPENIDKMSDSELKGLRIRGTYLGEPGTFRKFKRNVFESDDPSKQIVAQFKYDKLTESGLPRSVSGISISFEDVKFEDSKKAKYGEGGVESVNTLKKSFDTPEVITGTNSQYYNQFNSQVCDAPVGSIAKGAGYVYKKVQEDRWVSSEDEILRDIDVTRTIGGFEDSCIVYPHMLRD